MNVIPFPVRQNDVLQIREKKSEPLTIRVGRRRLNIRATYSLKRDIDAQARRYNISFSEAFRRCALFYIIEADKIPVAGLFDRFMSDKEFRTGVATFWWYSEW